MSALITASQTTKGKLSLLDKNHYSYVKMARVVVNRTDVLILRIAISVFIIVTVTIHIHMYELSLSL